MPTGENAVSKSEGKCSRGGASQLQEPPTDDALSVALHQSTPLTASTACSQLQTNTCCLCRHARPSARLQLVACMANFPRMHGRLLRCRNGWKPLFREQMEDVVTEQQMELLKDQVRRQEDVTS